MRVCIDPGHGMSNKQKGIYDPGAVHVENGVLYEEADINLKFSLALKNALQSRGIDTFLTRDDKFDHTPVGSRAAMGKQAGCGLLVSIHVNDFDDDSANGVEVLYANASSKKLAQDIQAGLVKSTGMKDRKIKQRTDLAVLKFDGKAVLVELGFIANDFDRNKLLNAQTRDAIIGAMASIIQTEIIA